MKIERKQINLLTETKQRSFSLILSQVGTLKTTERVLSQQKHPI